MAAARHARTSAESKLDGKESVLDKLRSALEVVAGNDTTSADRSSARAAVRQPVVAGSPNTTGRKPMNALSYMEDVEERWSYRLRAILTVVGVGLLVVVLGWAASELLTAVGDVWDALTAGL